MKKRYCFIYGLTLIVDGLAECLTLGKYNPNLSYKFLFWHSDMMLTKKGIKSG